MTNTYHTFVADQYGPRASNYVASTVHAAGEDLDQIEAAVRGFSTARVLDLGCGGGHVSYRIAAHVAEVIAVDLAAEMLEAVVHSAAERGMRNITVQQSAAERLPFADGYFDFVLCRFSAHHWHDFEAGLREAKRVLAPHGRAIFVDVVAPGSHLLDTHLQTMELLRDASHVRNHSTAEWIAALGRAGFAVTSIKPRRLRMEFSSWIARTHAPDLHAQAVRSLQEKASADVRSYFAITGDGSFLLDAVTFKAGVP
jgi:ubiquinone/menaquinone biosynthesis C-methylase UbiE